MSFLFTWKAQSLTPKIQSISEVAYACQGSSRLLRFETVACSAKQPTSGGFVGRPWLRESGVDVGCAAFLGFGKADVGRKSSIGKD